MNTVLQVGEQSFSAIEIVQRLVNYRMLPQLAKEIIIDQATADIVCSAEEKAQAQQNFFKKYQLASEADLAKWMQQNDVSAEQFETLLLRPVKLENFKRATWGSQLGSYFLKQKQNLDQAIYRLIRTQDVAIAQELYFRVQEGESSFEELAKEYSKGPEAQTGGLIGPRELSQAHPKLAQLLRTSQPGQVFPPVRVAEWFLIVRLEQLVPAQLDPPTEERLLNDLFNRWLQQQQQHVLLQFPDATVPGDSPVPDLQAPAPQVSEAVEI